MKKLTYLVLALVSLNAYSQEHFSGISTSKRVGILNGAMNPSEFANLYSKYEIQIVTTSMNSSNNKVGVKDLAKSDDIETLIFDGKGSVNFDISTEIGLPSFAMRHKKWGFALSSKSHIKVNIIDLDSDLANALINNELNDITGITDIQSTDNQRISATTWSEVGISAARTIFQTDKHQLNAGVTFKLLFPGSYANLGLNNFKGTIINSPNGLALTETNTSLNLAYSGQFASSFSDSNDYLKSMWGKLNGFATDFGVDYQLLNEDKSYKLKVGASVKNLGSMTFSGDDNVNENYALNIPEGQSLDLDLFEDVEGAQDVKDVLDNSGFFEKSSRADEFKVKLPTVFNFYADYKFLSRVSVTAFVQQKMGDQGNDDQISSRNMYTITPRVTFGAFETFVPFGNDEISGGTIGFGLRVGGFFLGSNSIVSAVTSNSKQADVYFGFRFGFRQN